MRAYYIVILVLFNWFNCIAQTEARIDWKSDLEYLKKELPKRHVNLFFKMSENEFNAGFDKLSEQLSQMDD